MHKVTFGATPCNAKNGQISCLSHVTYGSHMQGDVGRPSIAAVGDAAAYSADSGIGCCLGLGAKWSKEPCSKQSRVFLLHRIPSPSSSDSSLLASIAVGTK